MFSQVLPAFPWRRDYFFCNTVMVSRLGVFVGDFTDESSLLFKALGVISAIHYFFDALC